MFNLTLELINFCDVDVFTSQTPKDFIALTGLSVIDRFMPVDRLEFVNSQKFFTAPQTKPSVSRGAGCLMSRLELTHKEHRCPQK